MEFLSFKILLVIGFCIITEAGVQLFFKHAADGAGLLENLRKPAIWAGVICWALELVAWVWVLNHVPITIAFPMMSICYIAILFAGHLIFKERIHWQHALGALFIAAGVACVGLTGV